MWPVDFDGIQIADTSSWRKKSYPQLPLIKDFDKVDEKKISCEILNEVKNFSLNKKKGIFIFILQAAF